MLMQHEQEASFAKQLRDQHMHQQWLETAQILKSSLYSDLHSKYTRALTFQNLCQYVQQQMLWQQQQLPLNSTAALMADVAQTLQDIRVQQQDIAMSKWQERYYTNQAIMRGVST
jgi:hypothetical protein